MDPVVDLRAAVVLLGRFPALAGVDLVVDAGEILWLAGPNGAGKSTLLRLCAGLVPLQSGSAFVLGHDLGADRRAARRSVGLLGHATGLYDELTPTENLVFWARALRADVTAVVSALDRVALIERVRHLPVSQLSEGQRRRASLAAMLIRRPKLWLLDEPHAGLDAGARDLVDALCREAVAVGATVVFASHESDRARLLATRTVTVSGGMAGVMSPS